MKTRTLKILLTLPALLPFTSHAAITPLPVTGWLDDAIINNGSPSYDLSITGTVDNGPGNIEGGTFGATDTYPVQPSGAATAVSGLTRDIYTSATGSGATFQFQDFSSPNALLLKGSTIGTLTLDTPSSMTTLALFGTSGNGSTTCTVSVNFTDDSTSYYDLTTGITADWFNYSGSNATVALPIGKRVSNHHEDNYATIFYESNSVISIYESVIHLTAEDQAKKVSSLTIANTSSNGTLAIFAVSSDAAVATPTELKITASSFNFTTGQASLTFTSTTGVTYRATHSSTLNGTDWAAIGSNTPAAGASTTITFPFTKGAKDFFRVEVAP